MAGGIDVSNRKPRRLKGTPALRVINLYSLATLTVCCGIGYFFYKLPSANRLNAKLFPKEEQERENREREETNFILGNKLIGQKSASEIRQILRHKQKYETEL